jgi:hypothetical protein
MKLWRAGCPMALAVLTCMGTAQAAAFPSYEAVYELRLTHASATTGPRAAVGTMESRFAETCDGWDTKSRVYLALAFRDGSEYQNERLFSSWEGKNGKDYTFTARTTKNGEIVEDYKGKAAITRRGASAKYEVPRVEGRKRVRPIVVDLPRDVQFPVAHSKALLAHAARGDLLFRGLVLNGASSNGPRVTSVAIGPRVASAKPNVSSDIDADLIDTHFWRLSTAVFNLGEMSDTPKFELTGLLHESGVTESFEQRFGDFSISAKLTRLRGLPTPDCAKKR